MNIKEGSYLITKKVDDLKSLYTSTEEGALLIPGGSITKENLAALSTERVFVANSSASGNSISFKEEEGYFPTECIERIMSDDEACLFNSCYKDKSFGLLNISERNADFEYAHTILESFPKDKDFNKEVENYVANFYGDNRDDGDKEDDEECSYTNEYGMEWWLQDSKQLTYPEFVELKKYL